MMLYFITGSKHKFAEVHSIIGDAVQLNIDLPEIQELDARRIIEAKIREAFLHKQGEFIVEDTSLYLSCINDLPGPFIKWFLKNVGNEGLFNLAQKLGNDQAIAKTVIGYAISPTEIHFFEGIVNGRIVKPRGDSHFGWDPIFQPVEHSKTFAEMDPEEKRTLSMRSIAVHKLKKFRENLY